MTRSKLVAKIEGDIGWKGSSTVPMGVIREALSVDPRASTTTDGALEEFASNHGWQVRHDDDLITPRVIFSPI